MREGDSEYAQYLASSTKFRSFVRGFYRRELLKFIEGPTVDFGCGVGFFLEKLPDRSVGLDINPTCVEFCKKKNLNALHYDIETDDYSFTMLNNYRFDCMLISHVLEHLRDPKIAFSKLINSVPLRGIKRIVVAVPCEKGFRADSTHEKFIDEEFFHNSIILESTSFRVIHKKYFPINSRLAGNFLTHNELHVVLDMG